MKNGQLNQTWVDAEIAKSEDGDLKKFMQSFYKALGNDLKNATDTCSAGAISQKIIYNTRKILKAAEKQQ